MAIGRAPHPSDARLARHDERAAAVAERGTAAQQPVAVADPGERAERELRQVELPVCARPFSSSMSSSAGSTLNGASTSPWTSASKANVSLGHGEKPKRQTYARGRSPRAAAARSRELGKRVVEAPEARDRTPRSGSRPRAPRPPGRPRARRRASTENPSIASTWHSPSPPTRALVPIGSDVRVGQRAPGRLEELGSRVSPLDLRHQRARVDDVSVERLRPDDDRPGLELRRAGDADVKHRGRAKLGEAHRRPHGRLGGPDPAAEGVLGAGRRQLLLGCGDNKNHVLPKNQRSSGPRISLRRNG